MLKIFDLCLGYNMWYDRYCPLVLTDFDRKERDFLYFDRAVFDKLCAFLPRHGFNAVMIDVAEGLKYSCAPEISVDGALTGEELKGIVGSLKSAGLEVIPKLDFSAAHDIWLGVYSRMLSTPEYNALCEKMIDEVCEVFGSPRYFHLGLGDECNEKQKYYGYIVTRGAKAFKRDAEVMFASCRKNGAVPIMSGEYFLREPEIFRWTVPEDVIIDARYEDCFVSPADFFGCDKRSEKQKYFEKIFELKNGIIASCGLAGWNGEAESYFSAVKNKANVLGLMASPQFATVERNYPALLREIEITGRYM